jgi:hypothetical protein
MTPKQMILTSAIFLMTFACLSHYNNPKKRSDFFNGFAEIYMFLAIIGTITMAFDYNYYDRIPKKYDPYVFESFYIFVVYFIPCFIISMINFEGTVITLLKVRYLFRAKSRNQAISKRERSRKMKDYDKEIKDMEDKEEKIKAKIERIIKKTPELLPELYENFPEEVTLYEGYIKEIEKRFKAQQVKRTIGAQREKAAAARRLGEELANLIRSKAEIKRAKSELKTVNQEIKTREKRIESELERVDLESEVKKLELEAEKMSLEKKIGKTKISELEQHRQRIKEKADKKLQAQEVEAEEHLKSLEISRKTERKIEELKQQWFKEEEDNICKEFNVEHESQLPVEGKQKLKEGRERINDRLWQILARL